ncbi:hypothetical protein LJB90_03630 [Eubacteriales bacterium OttesenSCG-928-G02]|nr:hypothetical protein [Eubacteriales bacterium OttesenSCG-928-G02]
MAKKKIYLSNLEKDPNAERYSVGFIHYMPFDPKYGLGKTELELLETGKLVDEFPNPEIHEGYTAALYWYPDNTTAYDYVPTPEVPTDPTLEEIKQENELLKAEMDDLQKAFMTLTEGLTE